MPNTNGLMSGKLVTYTGADDSNAYVRVNGTTTGDVTIGGDLTISGEIVLDNADLSNNTGLVRYDVSGVSYPIYPSFCKIITPVAITKQTTLTKVTGLVYTIPQTGYYNMTAQISLASIGSSTPASDSITIYGDLSGGSVTPLNGAINTFNVVPNGSSAYYATSSGVLQQLMNAGDIIEFYHIESGGFTFGVSSAIGVTYTYLGNNSV